MRKTKQPGPFLEILDRVSELLSEHRILHRANLIFNRSGETRETLSETFAHVDQLLTPRESYLMWACHGYMHSPGCHNARQRTVTTSRPDRSNRRQGDGPGNSAT